MQKHILPLLIAVLLFSGCLEEASIEDRLACMELTSYSFTSIPNCATQEKCFEEVEKSFPFNEKVFSSRVQEELFQSKNHLAKAWLFLNNAKSNLKIIHNQCYSSKNLSLVPRQVNELNSNLIYVAEAIDSFNKSAVKAINFELDELELEGVNSIKEEFLFDDYIILNQNVLDFSQKNIYNDTYASRFLFEAEKFNAIAEALDLQNVIKETTLFTLLAENDKAIVKEAKKSDFSIPFFGPIFSGLASFLSDFFALSGSVQSLKSLPSFELFSAVNSLIGAENSAASAFFGVFINDSQHRVSLHEKNSLEKQRISQILEQSLEKISLISELHGEYFSLEAIFLDSESGISPVVFSQEELENFSKNFTEKVDAVKSSLRTIEEAEFLGTISLGEKTMRLKQLSKEASNILGELNYFEELVSGTEENCSEKLLQIKQKISLEEFDSADPAVISMRSRLGNQISLFETTKSIETCSDALKTYSSLLSYLDSTQPMQEISLQIDGCISSSEQLLGLGDFGDLGLQLDSLKRLEKPYQNPDLVLNSCLDINERLENELLSNPLIVQANRAFSEVKQNVSALKSIIGEFPNLKSEKSVEQLEKKIDSVSANFEETDLKVSSAQNSEQIFEELESILAESQFVLEIISSEAFEKYSSIEFFDSISGQDGNFARISFENLGSEVDALFSVVVQVDSTNAKEIFSTGNMSFLPQGEKTVVKFSKLLHGLNSLVLDLNANNPQELLDGEAVEIVEIDFAEKEKILSEKENLLAQAKSLEKQEEPELVLASEKIQFFADQNKLEKASEELKKLESIVDSFRSEGQSNENLEEKALELKEKVGEIKSFKLSLAEKVSLLESNFNSLSGDELEQVYAFSPITRERLGQLKQSYGSHAPLDEIISLIDEGKFSEALELAKNKGIDDLLSRLESEDQELTSAIEKLKQNSLSSYNVAVSDRNLSDPSPEADALMLKSRQALEEKSYLESIFNSQKASELSGFTALQQDFEIPLPIYPLLLVIMGVGFYVYKKSEEKKKPKPIVKIKKISD